MGTQKNCLDEMVLHMLKLMGKKIFTFYTQKFCLSKPVYDVIKFLFIKSQPYLYILMYLTDDICKQLGIRSSLIDYQA